MVRLSYLPSYTKDGDKALDKSTLIRLASMANAHEFHDAVNECLTAVGKGLSFEEAVTCLDELPQNLRHIDATKLLLEKAREVLVKGLGDPSILGLEEEEEAREDMLKKGADALATYLGPVSKLFEPVIEGKKDSTPVFGDALILKDQIKVSEQLLRLMVTCFTCVWSSTYVCDSCHDSNSPRMPSPGFFKVMPSICKARTRPFIFCSHGTGIQMSRTMFLRTFLSMSVLSI